jgi:hypothetical protein
MIKTVAQMLEQFLAKEKAVLNSSNITQTTTIGTMWENVSKSILCKSLPCDNLTVGSGFAEHPSGTLSKEFDCVLAIGEGRKIPYTDKLIFRPEQIVAIVQVKKTLYTKDLDDGFRNLQDILNFEIPHPPNCLMTVRRSFQIIANVPLPDDIALLNPSLKGLYQMLLCEAVNPCRILLGYYGFKTEDTFRQGIIDILMSFAGEKGWGPPSMPGYVIGNGFAAVKNTAMPYGLRMVNDWMPFYTTTSSISPLEILVEAIWSRLNFMGFADASLFGEDLTRDSFNRLIDARPVSELHWEIRFDGSSVPAHDNQDTADWEPWFVSQNAYMLVAILCKIFPKPLSRVTFAQIPGLLASIQELEKNGIAARRTDNNDLVELLTVECLCIILPDGRFAVGENDSGRMMRWVSNYTERC